MAIGKGLYPDWPPLDAVYSECKLCCLCETGVDRPVYKLRHATLKGKRNRELFIAMFRDRMGAAECLSCVDAILEAGQNQLAASGQREVILAPQ